MYEIQLHLANADPSASVTIPTGSFLTGVPRGSDEWIGPLAAVVDSLRLSEEARDYLRDQI